MVASQKIIGAEALPQNKPLAILVIRTFGMHSVFVRKLPVQRLDIEAACLSSEKVHAVPKAFYIECSGTGSGPEDCSMSMVTVFLAYHGFASNGWRCLQKIKPGHAPQLISTESKEESEEVASAHGPIGWLDQTLHSKRLV